MYETYTPQLGHIYWELDKMVSRALVAMTPPSGQALHGSTVGTLVRQGMAWRIKGQEGVYRDFGLTPQVGPNLSISFSDGLGNKLKIRKHPVDWSTGELVPLPWESPLPGLRLLQNPLFGGRLETLGLDMVVLWDPDVQTQALRSAVLAVVSQVDNSSKTKVLDCIELPTKQRFSAAARRRKAPPPSVQSWLDFFINERFGDDPDTA